MLRRAREKYGGWKSAPPDPLTPTRWITGAVCIGQYIIGIVLHIYAKVHNFRLVQTWSLDNMTAIGNNPEISYPILLGKHKCVAADMLDCLTDPAANKCCSAFISGDRSPGEKVNTLGLFGIAIFFPLILLLLRVIVLGSHRWCGWLYRLHNRLLPLHQRTAHQVHWYQRVHFHTSDAVLGLVASTSAAFMWTEVLKVMVGRPRPNYYALRTYAQFARNGAGSSKLFGNYMKESAVSFCSGHASLTMAGLLLMGLVMLRDLQGFSAACAGRYPRLAPAVILAASAIICWIPFISVLVGISRITDYWHRPDDVVAGWLFGIVAAVWSWYWVVLGPHRYEQQVAANLLEAAKDGTTIPDYAGFKPQELEAPQPPGHVGPRVAINGNSGPMAPQHTIHSAAVGQEVKTEDGYVV